MRTFAEHETSGTLSEDLQRGPRLTRTTPDAFTVCNPNPLVSTSSIQARVAQSTVITQVESTTNGFRNALTQFRRENQRLLNLEPR